MGHELKPSVAMLNTISGFDNENRLDVYGLTETTINLQI